MKNASTPLMEALRKRGISIMAAAKDGGVPYITVWRHCHGKSLMTLRSARRYSEKLGIPIAEIIGEEPGPGAEKQEQEGNGE